MPIKTAVAAIGLAMLTALPVTADQSVEDALKKIANGPVNDWVIDRTILTAVRNQNIENAGLSQDEILELDKSWRAETITGGPLVSGVLANALSDHLREIQTNGGGRYTEIFVTDALGLNVGQSDVTSDYWQGDEDKWQVPFATRGIHMGEVEFDESTQTYQSQLSAPIMSDGQVIGVITVGVNIEMLAQLN